MLPQWEHLLVKKVEVECETKGWRGADPQVPTASKLSCRKRESRSPAVLTRPATARIDRGGLESMPGYTCMRCAENNLDFTSPRSISLLPTHPRQDALPWASLTCLFSDIVFSLFICR